MSFKSLMSFGCVQSIKYTSLTGDRLNEAVDVIHKWFFTYENICKIYGLANSLEAMKDFDEMIIDIFKQGVSLIAIHEPSNKIVGLALNMLQNKTDDSIKIYNDYLRKCKYEESQKVIKFLIDVEKDNIDLFKLYNNADNLMEVLFLAVSPEHSRKGIGLILTEKSLNLASLLKKGENVKVSLDGNKELSLEPYPDIVTSILTSYKTQNIFQKLNFDVVKKLSYKSLFGEVNAPQDTEEIIFVCKRV